VERLVRNGAQLRVVYVSYDGALDPLGASQVVPYLGGLAQRGVALTLVSFEKTRRWHDVARRQVLAAYLTSRGVDWRPRPYHGRPRLLATLWDVVEGARAIRSCAATSGATLVHCRGDVTMAMARWARLGSFLPLLYDMRGFFADERVEGGSWRKGSLIDRLVRRAERRNLERAGGVVVLTRRAMARLQERRPSLPPHRVIPTCVDLDRFFPREAEQRPEYGLVYVGSLGTWYMVREMIDFARIASPLLAGPALFLTPDVEIARAAGATPDWADVRSVAPADVPAWLRRARASFFFIRPTPSKQASCPTKFAEALATGLPVAANEGIGDLDGDLARENVGVLVRAFDARSYEAAARRLAAIADDPTAVARCRDWARRNYALGLGVEAYYRLYEEIADVSRKA
jgi:glycosyltransferase involved in cell wall biosynthesis